MNLPHWLELPFPTTDALTSLLQAHIAPTNTTSPSLLDTLFLQAMLQHQSGRHTSFPDVAHIYLKQFEIPQIELFDLLLNHFPFVTVCHNIANQHLAQALQDCTHAALLDIGIGRGFQMARLLPLLADTRLQELTIIGVEPFAEALSFAEQTVRQAASTLPFTLSFVGIQCLAEQLTTKQIRTALPNPCERLAVNCAFALHHIPAATQRQQLFYWLREFQPHLLLIEPHGEHLQDDWQARTRSAYRTYGLLFQLIDELDVSLPRKNGLKLFFGREIEDVVGLPTEERYERHESDQQWLAYLTQAGYNLQSIQIPNHSPLASLRFVQPQAGLLRVTAHDQVLLSVFQARGYPTSNCTP
jgi:hypothetical protein